MKTYWCPLPKKSFTSFQAGFCWLKEAICTTYYEKGNCLIFPERHIQKQALISSFGNLRVQPLHFKDIIHTFL
jgi:hypothetical protein